MTTEKTEVIDITPTWLGILPALVAIVESGDAEGRKLAREELRRMAGLADAHVATLRNVMPLAKALREALADLDSYSTTAPYDPRREQALALARELASRF